MWVYIIYTGILNINTPPQKTKTAKAEDLQAK